MYSYSVVWPEINFQVCTNILSRISHPLLILWSPPVLSSRACGLWCGLSTQQLNDSLSARQIPLVSNDGRELWPGATSKPNRLYYTGTAFHHRQWTSLQLFCFTSTLTPWYTFQAQIRYERSGGNSHFIFTRICHNRLHWTLSVWRRDSSRKHAPSVIKVNIISLVKTALQRSPLNTAIIGRCVRDGQG